MVGTLIAIAYHTNGRLTKLETSMEWVKDTLRGLMTNFQNTKVKAFKAEHSAKKDSAR